MHLDIAAEAQGDQWHRRGGKTALDEALHARDHILPAMEAVRTQADALEELVADDLWPLPA